MKYRELLDEYTRLLQANVHLRNELNKIPKGYIVTKRISGNTYSYLQYTLQGKKKTDYIREECLPNLRAAIDQRAPLKARLEENQTELIRLESAAKILDTNLYRIFFFLKQCADMDAISIEKRRVVLEFAGAMTALEGLSPKEETQANLEKWAVGHKNFVEIYMTALQNYGIVEVT